MYIVTAPWLLRKLFPNNIIWNLPGTDKEIYLTFDDGPHPAATNFVLEQLKNYNAKGTFFCIGKNVIMFQDLYFKIIGMGHRVGNHTFDHLNGRKTNDARYFENIALASQYIDSNLFRPPYGSITRFQANQLSMKYKIVMWSVLSADFDKSITKEKCLQNVLKNTKPGSFIVFHDSEKAFPHLEYVLPKVLKHFSEMGYKFSAIPL